MKVKIDIIENENHYNVLRAINKGNTYAHMIAKHLDITASKSLRYCQELEAENFIKSTKLKKYNQRIYEINYPQLIQFFYKYLKDKSIRILKNHGESMILNEDFEEAYSMSQFTDGNFNTNNKILNILLIEYVKLILQEEELTNTIRGLYENLIGLSMQIYYALPKIKSISENIQKEIETQLEIISNIKEFYSVPDTITPKFIKNMNKIDFSSLK